MQCHGSKRPGSHATFAMGLGEPDSSVVRELAELGLDCSFAVPAVGGDRPWDGVTRRARPIAVKCPRARDEIAAPPRPRSAVHGHATIASRRLGPRDHDSDPGSQSICFPTPGTFIVTATCSGSCGRSGLPRVTAGRPRRRHGAARRRGEERVTRTPHSAYVPCSVCGPRLLSAVGWRRGSGASPSVAFARVAIVR